MKIAELREMGDEDLLVKEKALKKEMFDLTFQKEFGQVEKSGRFRLMRKDIARIQTIFTEREKENHGQKRNAA